ncbi:MAG: hypothetical protein AB1813_19710 [Verrucomicrobiota bacterium]
MYWMFTGYLLSFYAALTACAIFELPTHPKPLLGAAAFFLIIPTVVAVISMESILLAPNAWHRAIRDALARGRLTKRYVIFSGVVTGLVVIIFGVGAYFLSGFLESRRVDAFGPIALAMLLLVALSPIVPGYWLVCQGRTP